MGKRKTNIKFPYNREKAIQATLWFLNKHSGILDRLQLVKLMFLADREHLVRYGRPVVGGNYCAMKLGPVLSELLDDLNHAKNEGTFPFQSIGHNVHTDSKAREEVLSESDIEVFEIVDREYGKLDRFKLAGITHDLKAWKKNYPDENISVSNPLPYEDFFLDVEDDSILEIIRDNQAAWTRFE